MSRMKSIFAGLLLTAITGVVPMAQAQTPRVIISGSSAMWQGAALGAYGGGTCSPLLTGCVSPTMHWTSAKNSVNLNDQRPTPPNNDAGTLWIVWDSASPPNVWAYDKVDSVVGDRCLFARPSCNIIGTLPAGGAGAISSTLWGADTNLPASIITMFGGAGTPVTAAATDIRPEDAAFAECRVNSQLGASVAGGGLSDGLDGLGYGLGSPANAAGVCPKFGAAPANLVGSPIKSAVSILEGGTTVAQANVVAFNITGHDPFNNTTVPAFTVTAVGAAPIIFITERDKGKLNNVTNANEIQLQQVFSGANCSGSGFDGGVGGAINVFLREPLSGTFNTAEATVFRRPTIYPVAPGVLGISQETGVTPPADNPLAKVCAGGGGKRWGVVGTGEEVAGVQNSGTAAFGSLDGIGYTFFSYGNVTGVANQAKYGYLQLNGVDPIFETYGVDSTGAAYDPGQPTIPGALPNAATLPVPVCAAAFPCPESSIWKNGFSFPNVRNGTYRAWSLLRFVAFTGTNSTNAANLAKASAKFVVTSVPDYIPAAAVAGTGDLGLKLLRSHYVQKDGAGLSVEKVGAATNVPENGGDMGGAIIPTTIGVTTSKVACRIQNATPVSPSIDIVESLGPAQRPLVAGACK
jgi:hypothetical protein